MKTKNKLKSSKEATTTKLPDTTKKKSSYQQQQQQQDSNNDNSSKNKNTPSEFEEYRERQRNEVEVLKSIFMEEFHEIKPVWGGVSIELVI